MSTIERSFCKNISSSFYSGSSGLPMVFAFLFLTRISFTEFSAQNPIKSVCTSRLSNVNFLSLAGINSYDGDSTMI